MHLAVVTKDSILLHHPPNGRMRRLPWRRASLLDVRLQFRLLVDRGGCRGLREDRFRFASRTLPIQTMPLGLKNAPSIFERSIDIILVSVKWPYAIVYLDDIIFFSSTIK